VRQGLVDLGLGSAGAGDLTDGGSPDLSWYRASMPWRLCMGGLVEGVVAHGDVAFVEGVEFYPAGGFDVYEPGVSAGKDPRDLVEFALQRCLLPGLSVL